MTLYFMRFKHNTRNDVGDLVAHIDHWGEFRYPDDFEEFEDIVKVRFEKLFDGEYGKYGRSYVLRDFGTVKVGKGYLVETHDSEHTE